MQHFRKCGRFLTVLLFFFGGICSAQELSRLDSLKIIYENRSYKGGELDLLKEIAEEENDPEVKLKYCDLLIQKASEDSVLSYLHSGFLQKGNAYQLQANYAQALEFYFKSLELAKRIDEDDKIGALNISIADTYSMIGNSATAYEYYDKGIELLRSSKDTIHLASALLNVGEDYFQTGNYDKALKYYKESRELFDQLDYPMGIAYNLGNVGMVYAKQGKYELAEENINEAITLLETLEDFYAIAVYLTYLSDIYMEKDNLHGALRFSERSLELAKKYGLKDQIADADLKLAQLYEAKGDSIKAYAYFKEHSMYRDSVKNLETVQNMAELRNDYEIAQKQVENNLLEEQKKTQKIILIATGIALFLILLLLFGLYRRNKFIKRTSKIIERERNRSDHLLENILPEQTAQELKDYGKVKSQKFDSVSVLFTDFKDFTKVSENFTPELLVESVDYYFSKFDEIIEKYDLEKIKTIGDSYMCAGGLPFASEDHALKTVMAACDIIEFVKNNSIILDGREIKYDVRVGINTGAVIAGVVGRKKFAYDIWGDTVNVAARMESSAESGHINVSEETYDIIKDYFTCEYRGEIYVKNKGMMKMFYVTGLADNRKIPEPDKYEERPRRRSNQPVKA